MTIPEPQASVIRPAVERLAALRQAVSEQEEHVLRLAAMVEPRILDPASGIEFAPGTLTLTYPAPTEP